MQPPTPTNSPPPAHFSLPPANTPPASEDPEKLVYFRVKFKETFLPTFGLKYSRHVHNLETQIQALTGLHPTQMLLFGLHPVNKHKIVSSQTRLAKLVPGHRKSRSLVSKVAKSTSLENFPSLRNWASSTNIFKESNLSLKSLQGPTPGQIPVSPSASLNSLPRATIADSEISLPSPSSSLTSSKSVISPQKRGTFTNPIICVVMEKPPADDSTDVPLLEMPDIPLESPMPSPMPSPSGTGTHTPNMLASPMTSPRLRRESILLDPHGQPISKNSYGYLVLAGRTCLPCLFGKGRWTSPEGRNFSKEQLFMWIMTFSGCLSIFTVLYFVLALLLSNEAWGPSVTILIDFGASYPPLIFTPHYQVYRLITNIFLHGNWLHLGFNMLALAKIGPMLERVWLSPKYEIPHLNLFFIYCFLLTGVFGSCSSMLFHPPQTISVGASGSLLGIIGCQTAFWFVYSHATTQKNEEYSPFSAQTQFTNPDGTTTIITPPSGAEQRKHVSQQLLLFAAFAIFLPFIFPSVSFWAHAGGFTCGFLIGMFTFGFLRPSSEAMPTKSTREYKMYRAGQVCGVILVACFIGFGIVVFASPEQPIDPRFK